MKLQQCNICFIFTIILTLLLTIGMTAPISIPKNPRGSSLLQRSILIIGNPNRPVPGWLHRDQHSPIFPVGLFHPEQAKETADPKYAF
ncbi:hypothetical protein L211DRAFT_838121 [Terfezia boudieri ATCC MYA-4762]|uniref:Uncharacterized protein n=1 Tax=Terfezia boudieri ATCC MYA-4762 TaxID=1051890 RepID=A0A3N4LSK0_9PEZI|nr:hypothetical protein L211DRAFT_838121 [Terfezia boudieri ATCC MYA-4762]